MRLSVTSRRPGGVGQPPARLRGTMKNASTGQMRSSNPPPACGAACARVRRSRFGVWPHGKAHSARPVGSRMRFSVTTRPQNAPFRRVRLSSPAQTQCHLTEKRILRLRRDEKAQFAFDAPPKLRFRERVQCLPRLGMNQNRSRPRPSRPPPESAASA